MKAWRIVLAKFGRTRRVAFSGLSGFSADGRWHSAGRHLDYAAQSLSLAILERLVHYKRFDALEPHVLYALEVPTPAIETVATPPDGWDGADPLRAAQAVGDAWCDEQRSPALLVPSGVTPGEHNLIVNSHHPGWRWDWVISGPQAFAFDDRLLGLMPRPRPL
ncbi:MAG: RES family NAD+ phosphorylase [Steroidobacteraceae bacterium]